MGHTMRPSSEREVFIPAMPSTLKPSLNSGIETADSADFTDFEGVIGDEPTNPLVGKTQGIVIVTYCIRVIRVIYG